MSAAADPRVPDWRLSREGVAAVLEARALAIGESRAPNKVQPHSKLLPTEAEQAEAAFASRMLNVLAQEFRTGLHDDGPPQKEQD